MRSRLPATISRTADFQQATSRSIQERLQFETLLADVSTRFVNLPADQIDPEIENGLERIAEVLQIDRCSVAQFSEERTRLRVTHAFALSGVTPMPDLILNEQQPWYTQKLLKYEPIVMSNVDELPEEAAIEKAYCIRAGVKSSVLIPLAVGGAFLGVVGFASLSTERHWPEVLVQRLNLLGVVFANALMRKQSEQKLHKAFLEIQILKDRLEAENMFLREEISLQFAHEEIIGQSDAIKHVLSQAEQVATTDTTVMLLGETGTGKEIMAQAIHKLSKRRRRTMVTVNCAALPSNLVESELFGHEKGAYTGAESKRIGRFELADGATLFLDEIGELRLPLQAKLLRVLQRGQFERVGGHKTITSDARVIAATNRDLLQAVHTGDFRMDLYYRLNVFPIVMPPLRERRDDIPALVWFFVKSFCEKMGKRIETIPRNSMQVLQNYNWPGNVRELKNFIERAMIITTGKALQIELPGNPNAMHHQIKTLDQALKDHLLQILDLTNWRVRGKNGAAEVLSLKPTTLESKMAKLGIKRPAKG
ncbi:MAG: sigma 54-interacting transcriptional regulator [Desulfosarcina sp.]|nr:sigma 54-interacting transcriptional regulator [Desulfobacterales bacterium]